MNRYSSIPSTVSFLSVFNVCIHSNWICDLHVFYCFYCVWIENRMFYISKIACLDITVVVRHIWLHSRYVIMYNVYYADFLCCLRRDAFFTMARASSASRRIAKTYKTMLVFLVYYYLIFHFTWAAFPRVCHDVLFYFVH